MAHSQAQIREYLPSPDNTLRPHALPLGLLIFNPFDPRSLVNRKGAYTIPEDLKISEVAQGNYKWHDKVTHQSAIGLWASWVARLDAKKIKVDIDDFEAKELVTREFAEPLQPSSKYLRDSMGTPAVAAHFSGSGFGKRVFMVTGVKIAKGVKKASLENSTITKGDGKLGIHVTGNLGAGIKGTLSVKDDQTQSFKAKEDIVFAYRLLELYYGKKMELIARTYTVGAVHSIEDIDPGETKQKEEVQPTDGIEYLGCAAREVIAEDLNCKSIAVFDEIDGVECKLLVPPTSEEV
jgi:hypothetical protein